MARILSAGAGTLALLLTAASASPAMDEVQSLPGWDRPLKSKHYSGYLPVGNLTGVAGMLHYWLIESENSPSTSPVVLWLNGGPGSSSLIGLLTENGQVATNEHSIGPEGSMPQLFYNPYSWSQVANVIYLEQPKGVGFSYCTGGSEGCDNTDESTAMDSYEALVGFFDSKFPEYKRTEFYITGESYAGTYIPMIMDVADKQGGLPNLKGAMIGNGCYGNKIGLCGNSHYEKRVDAEIFAGHTMIPQTLHTQIAAECPSNFSSHTPSLRCTALYEKMENDLGEFNVYNIYDQCPSSDHMLSAEQLLGGGKSAGEDCRRKPPAAAAAATAAGAKQQKGYTLSELHKSRRAILHADGHGYEMAGLSAALHPHPQLNERMGGALNDWTCGGEDGMQAWLAQPKVQAALHVSGHANSQMSYRSTVDDLRPVYRKLAMKYRMLIYSGDVDACVPYYASETWTRELGFPEVEPWRPWTAPSLDGPDDDGIRAGYVIRYATGTHTGNFTFATVAGAGHMAPTFKPPQALALLKRFLANQPL